VEVPAYETYLRQEPWRFLEEGDRFFMGDGKVNEALRQLAHRFREADIAYAIVGAMALGRHGLERFTVDVDVLITKEGLAEFRAKYEGLGYVPAFPGAQKKFRATETGVRVDFITTGEFPGDGKPKPVVFPDPASAFVEIDGVRVITLERFVELKLASGMTADHRVKDIGDVQELIRHAKLSEELAERLDSSVRDEYRRLWRTAQVQDPLDEQPPL
jgi:hypothetical protein